MSHMILRYRQNTKFTAWTDAFAAEKSFNYFFNSDSFGTLK